MHSTTLGESPRANSSMNFRRLGAAGLPLGSPAWSSNNCGLGAPQGNDVPALVIAAARVSAESAPILKAARLMASGRTAPHRLSCLGNRSLRVAMNSALPFRTAICSVRLTAIWTGLQAASMAWGLMVAPPVLAPVLGRLMARVLAMFGALWTASRASLASSARTAFLDVSSPNRTLRAGAQTCSH
jgi:hypothetical protein